MAPSDRRPIFPRPNPHTLGFAFVPGLPRVGGVSQRLGPERRPRPLATPQTRRAHIGNDLFPFSPLEEVVPRRVGEKRLPYRHSDEARRKISAANKGNIPWNKGRKHTEETKRKIATATKMAMQSPQVREKLRAQAIGRRHTEATKRKIRNASRVLHGGLEAVTGRKPRTPVPFKFSRDLVAALDSRISKRYKKMYVESKHYTQAGRLRRPMPESTKKKLSARIKEMWASPDYREKVLSGIEAHNKKRDPRLPLSESHKEAIRQTLLKRHAALRRAKDLEGLKPHRRPRSSSAPLDPTEGTRFSERLMSSESLRERERRRLMTTQILLEAEEKESRALENINSPEAVAERRRVETEEEVARKCEEQDLRETNRLLLESLAMAGQLPSLDDEASVLGGDFDLSNSANPSESNSGVFGFGEEVAKEPPFSGNGLGIEPSGPIDDPLLHSPEQSFLSPSLASVQPNFNDIFTSVDEQPFGAADFSFSASPTARPRVRARFRRPAKRLQNIQDDTPEMSLTESVPLGQALVYGEGEEENGNVGVEIDDEEDVNDAFEDEELSIAETNAFTPSSGFSESLGSMGDMDSMGSSEYGNELQTITADSSPLLQGMASAESSRRIVTYVNGKRVL